MRRLAASAPHGKPYVDLSLGLKQKIWEMDNDVFKQELAASITRLGNDPDSVGKVTPRLLKALPTAIFTPTTSSSDIPLVNPSYEKSRRELNVELSAICNRIGANEKLLLSTLRIVRNRFIETGSMAFCTLSLDLVFAMREVCSRHVPLDSHTHFVSVALRPWSLSKCIPCVRPYAYFSSLSQHILCSRPNTSSISVPTCIVTPHIPLSVPETLLFVLKHFSLYQFTLLCPNTLFAFSLQNFPHCPAAKSFCVLSRDVFANEC